MKITITDTVAEVALELGRRIQKLRLSRNWTQQELAARAGISRVSVARLESAACDVKVSNLLSVCSALGVLARFDSLIEDVQLSPQQVLAGESLPRRARRNRKLVRVKWGDGK